VFRPPTRVLGAAAVRATAGCLSEIMRLRLTQPRSTSISTLSLKCPTLLHSFGVSRDAMLPWRVRRRGPTRPPVAASSKLPAKHFLQETTRTRSPIRCMLHAARR